MGKIQGHLELLIRSSIFPFLYLLLVNLFVTDGRKRPRVAVMRQGIILLAYCRTFVVGHYSKSMTENVLRQEPIIRNFI